MVASGDPNAAANHGKGNDKSHRDKKIPNDQRTTTPFMTKYEKARILGTRALQIRWVVLSSKSGRGWGVGRSVADGTSKHERACLGGP